MDPILKSVITTIATGAAGSLATWAVTVGVIPSSDQATIINAIVALALYAITFIVLPWFKSLSHTASAQIAAVNNAENGRKVVDNSSPSPMVTTAKPVS